MRSPSDAAACRRRNARRGRTTTCACRPRAAAGLVPALAVTPPALAASGGAGVAPAPRRAGRRPSGPAPMILDVRCVDNPGGPCVETHRVERGGTVRVSGRNLGRAAQLLFYGSKGERDDAVVPRRAAAPGEARRPSVPASARSGPVAVLDAFGPALAALDRPGARRPAERLRHLPAARRAQPGAGRGLEAAPDLLRRHAEGRLHLRRRRRQRHGPAGQPRARDRRRRSCRAGTARPAPPATQQPRDLERQRRGPRRSRRAATPSASARSAPRRRGLRSAPSAPGDESVSLYGHVFPVRGTHDFGSGGARLRRRAAPATRTRARTSSPPAARRWSPPAAARWSSPGFHAAAGYYVVIDGKGTGRRLRLHAPAPARAPCRSATRSTPARTSARWATPATRRAATCTSRNGPRRAGTTAAARSTRCPDLKRWDRTS